MEYPTMNDILFAEAERILAKALYLAGDPATRNSEFSAVRARSVTNYVKTGNGNAKRELEGGILVYVNNY